MPTYEYGCSDCGHRFETFQSIKDEPLSVCPSCGGGIHRIIGTGGGIIFKGSGFYITDYRSEGYKKAAAKDKPSVASTSKESKKTDKKPASAKD
jgi:putative FmdB family regulatory protein